MTSRERFLALLAGKPLDRLPFILRWGPWGDTIKRWRSEGMERDDDWQTLFGFDDYQVHVGVSIGIYPPFDEKILADEGDTVVRRDANGVVKRDRKNDTTMPQFLEYPVKDRKSWEEHKWRFDPGTPGRFPRDWPRRAKELRDSHALVAFDLYPYGFFGGARTMMGAEQCLVSCALDPELIEDINATLCNLWYVLWTRIFEETRVDHVQMWEDMAGRQGSLISPAMFRRFLTPNYRKLTTLARGHGVPMISVDSDGFMHELTGLFLEAGVNTVFPWEVQAGNDLPFMLRKYPGLLALGGMDKRAMANGDGAIEAEMERVRRIMELGRYVPFPDHLIPSDVPWAGYQRFVWRWKELVGKKD